MVIKYRHKQEGGHIHVRVFMGRDGDHLALCGRLVFNLDEWKAFENLQTNKPGRPLVWVKPEDN